LEVQKLQLNYSINKHMQGSVLLFEEQTGKQLKNSNKHLTN